MNTIGSVYYGWAFLILCGGGSYYFAKRSINADREARQRMDVERRMKLNKELELHERQRTLKAQEELAHPRTGEETKSIDGRLKGEIELGKEAVKQREESEYEARVPYRARKGDRFSGW